MGAQHAYPPLLRLEQADPRQLPRGTHGGSGLRDRVAARAPGYRPEAASGRICKWTYHLPDAGQHFAQRVLLRQLPARRRCVGECEGKSQPLHASLTSPASTPVLTWSALWFTVVAMNL